MGKLDNKVAIVTGGARNFLSTYPSIAPASTTASIKAHEGFFMLISENIPFPPERLVS